MSSSGKDRRASVFTPDNVEELIARSKELFAEDDDDTDDDKDDNHAKEEPSLPAHLDASERQTSSSIPQTSGGDDDDDDEVGGRERAAAAPPRKTRRRRNDTNGTKKKRIASKPSPRANEHNYDDENDDIVLTQLLQAIAVYQKTGGLHGPCSVPLPPCCRKARRRRPRPRLQFAWHVRFLHTWRPLWTHVWMGLSWGSSVAAILVVLLLDDDDMDAWIAKASVGMLLLGWNLVLHGWFGMLRYATRLPRGQHSILEPVSPSSAWEDARNDLARLLRIMPPPKTTQQQRPDTTTSETIQSMEEARPQPIVVDKEKPETASDDETVSPNSSRWITILAFPFLLPQCGGTMLLAMGRVLLEAQVLPRFLKPVWNGTALLLGCLPWPALFVLLPGAWSLWALVAIWVNQHVYLAYLFRHSARQFVLALASTLWAGGLVVTGDGTPAAATTTTLSQTAPTTSTRATGAPDAGGDAVPTSEAKTDGTLEESMQAWSSMWNSNTDLLLINHVSSTDLQPTIKAPHLVTEILLPESDDEERGRSEEHRPRRSLERRPGVERRPSPQRSMERRSSRRRSSERRPSERRSSERRPSERRASDRCPSERRKSEQRRHSERRPPSERRTSDRKVRSEQAARTGGDADSPEDLRGILEARRKMRSLARTTTDQNDGIRLSVQSDSAGQRQSSPPSSRNRSVRSDEGVRRSQAMAARRDERRALRKENSKQLRATNGLAPQSAAQTKGKDRKIVMEKSNNKKEPRPVFKKEGSSKKELRSSLKKEGSSKMDLRPSLTKEGSQKKRKSERNVLNESLRISDLQPAGESKRRTSTTKRRTSKKTTGFPSLIKIDGAESVESIRFDESNPFEDSVHFDTADFDTSGFGDSSRNSKGEEARLGTSTAFENSTHFDDSKDINPDIDDTNHFYDQSLFY